MNKVSRVILILILTMFGPGCSPVLEAPRLTSIASPKPPNVVVVTVDGVRWEEVFHGADDRLADEAQIPPGESRSPDALTPHLRRLFFGEGIVVGDPRLGALLTPSGPLYVSLPSYVEIMTGRASGCVSNACTPRVEWSLASALAERGGKAAVFASWERIARALPEEHLVYREIGRSPGDVDPPYPGHGMYRPDRLTAERAVRYLVDEKPRFLWLALGDTDEWAHRWDYRRYLEALTYADHVIGELCAHVDSMPEYRGNTIVLVTTDHGRERFFSHHWGEDSAPVWMMVRGLGRRGSIGLYGPRYLRDVAPTVLQLYGVEMSPCPLCGSAIPELVPPRGRR